MFIFNIRYFPFFDGNVPVRMKIFRQPGKLVPTTRRSNNIQLVQSWLVTHTKKLEEVYFADEEFLHKKVNKNGVYRSIMVCYRRCSRSYGI